jgi:hypothetical protein
MIHGRRGDMQRLYLILFEIFIVVLLAFVVIRKVSTVNLDYQKRFLSKDIALLTDAAYASPVPFEYQYGFPGLANHSITFDKQVVSVTGRSYPFAQDLSIRSSFAFKPAETFRFKREPGVLEFIPRNFYPYKLACPSERSTVNAIILDPEYGWDETLAEGERQKNASITDDELATLGAGDKGAAGRNTNGTLFYEYDLNRHVAIALKSALVSLLGPQSDAKILTTRALGTAQALSIRARREKIAGMPPKSLVLSIRSGIRDAPADVPLIVYVNGRSARLNVSMAAACAVLNALAEKYHLTHSGIVPIDADLLPLDDGSTARDEEDPLRVLAPDRPGITIELGNLNNPDDPMQKDIAALAGAISSGLLQAVQLGG